jgi:2-iminobutanoate/2-iminopropanoate deaminase
MNNFLLINAVYSEFFKQHFPVCAGVEVARLPRDANAEADPVDLRQ